MVVEPDLEDQRGREGIAVFFRMAGSGKNTRSLGRAVTLVHEMDANPRRSQAIAKMTGDPFTSQCGLAPLTGLGQCMADHDGRDVMLFAERFDEVNQGAVAATIMCGMGAGEDFIGVAKRDARATLARIKCEDHAHETALSRWPSPAPRPHAESS